MESSNNIIRFKDLTFKPHPVASKLFTGQAIVMTKNNGRISIVGPRTSYLLFDYDDLGKYEILYSEWEDPVGYISEDEVDNFLIKIQKGPLDLMPEIKKHRFNK